MLHIYTITYTHFSMFLKKSNQLTLIGLGSYGINYNKINFNNSKVIINKKNKSFLVPSVQFNTKNCIEKLNNLGFTFTNSNYINNYYPIKTGVEPQKFLLNNTYTTGVSTSLVLTTSTSLRTIHTYLTLLNTITPTTKLK